MGDIRQLPFFLNLNAGFEKITAQESPFLKGLGWNINANGQLSTGTGNPSGEGQNEYILSPTRSNVQVKDAFLPAGFNKNCGSFESIVTREMYYFNFNSEGNHGIYVISGDTLVLTKIIIDPELFFSDKQEAFIAEHRVTLRCTYNEDKTIKEKHLIITNGDTWQKWINVIASIKTNGFDAALFPYWNLQPPHFDRRELLEYAPRPSMIAPDVASLPNTVADLGNDNLLIDRGFQFCYEITYTDGRYTTVSPWSLPHLIKSEEFLSNPNLITKKLRLRLYAGSPLVEKITLYMRVTVPPDYGSDLVTWSAWVKYDTINKFTDCGVNDEVLIGNDYWLRQNQWDGMNYDPVQNTFDYIFSNDKQGQIVAQERVQRVFNGMPIRSTAMGDIGDGVLLGNNEYGFDNFSCNTTNGLGATVNQKPDIACNVPLRTITLYSYIGLYGDKFKIYVDDDPDRGHFLSQVGYFNSPTEKQQRFGAIQLFAGTGISVNNEYSEQFQLDFADRSSFRCYLKGTQYYADGDWYYVNASNVKIKIEELLDISLTSTRDFIYSVYSQGGYFICQYDFVVPAGYYTATLGRHNVKSSDDYRNQSTYLMGIANSLLKTHFSYFGTTGYVSIRPEVALVDTSKEVEIDCTLNNVDVWGNGHDLFYVFAPTPVLPPSSHHSRWRFLEGYLRESRNVPVPMEVYPYYDNRGGAITGTVTDKNGFYFSMDSGGDRTPQPATFIYGNKNCTYTSAPAYNWGGTLASLDNGWAKDVNIFAADIGGTFGDCNRILLKGSVKDLTGTIGFSNIGISIKDGATVFTDSNGNFTLIIHNGGNVNNSKRIANVYINAGGDFVITGMNCTYIVPYVFNENNVPCINCNVRQLTIADTLVAVQSGGQQSVKTNGKYEIGGVGADLAGRLTFINKIKEISVPSFLKINKVVPFFFKWTGSGNLKLPDDIKWFAFYITRNVAYTKYVQWIGDYMKYVDSAGNITTDAASSVLVQVGIDSLLNANITSNFSLLANYSFKKGDRVRILDNGSGVLLNTATFGDAIDLQIEGTNYNQAAANAGLLPQNNTVVNITNNTVTGTVVSTPNTVDTAIFLKYDSRLDILKDKKGFWIEIYSNAQVVDELPYFEVGSFYPVVNNEIAIYQGGGILAPVYTFPTGGTLDYWDTYFLKRSIAIPNIGNRYFSHPFESPNVTDRWGINLSSGGRANAVNEYATRYWDLDNIIKSNDFVGDGLINGLATFLKESSSSFKGYKWGGIIAIRSINSYIFFLCENDYFTTDYNYHYARPNAQGVMVVNLSNDISDPHQKIGNNSGCDGRDTATVIMHEDFVSWHDRKNGSYMMSDYRQVFDITETIMAYYSEKCKFVGEWNEGVANEFMFDVTAGLDMQRNLIYVSFRPRRGNTDDKGSFINNRRNLQTDFQETLVYSIDAKRWARFEGFVGESYGKLRGSAINNEMYSFASGIPYAHLNTPTNSFSIFYGVQTTPVVMSVPNVNPEIIKVLQCVSQDTNDTCLWIDQIYSVAPNSFTYAPLNHFKKREGFRYATVLRDAASYPPPDKEELFRSMFFDGKKMVSPYFVVRYVWDKNKLSEYGEVNSLNIGLIPMIIK